MRRRTDPLPNGTTTRKAPGGFSALSVVKSDEPAPLRTHDTPMCLYAQWRRSPGTPPPPLTVISHSPLSRTSRSHSGRNRPSGESRNAEKGIQGGAVKSTEQLLLFVTPRARLCLPRGSYAPGALLRPFKTASSLPFVTTGCWAKLTYRGALAGSPWTRWAGLARIGLRPQRSQLERLLR